jgi:hypothetical protein
MNKIESISLGKTIVETAKNCAVSYLIFSLILSIIMGFYGGFIVGGFLPVIAFFLIVCEHIVARQRGLRCVEWNDSTITLHYVDKIVTINSDDIKQIEQRHTVSYKFGFRYLDIFILEVDTEKIKMDLRNFPQNSLLIEDINRRIALKNKRKLDEQLRNAQEIKDCQYDLGTFCKLIIDVANHKIIFRNLLTVTVVDLNQVQEMKLEDIEAFNGEHLLRWTFEMKRQDGKKQKNKFIFDKPIAMSKQKEEIRMTIILVCKAHNISVNLKRLDKKYFK